MPRVASCRVQPSSERACSWAGRPPVLRCGARCSDGQPLAARCGQRVATCAAVPSGGLQRGVAAFLGLFTQRKTQPAEPEPQAAHRQHAAAPAAAQATAPPPPPALHHQQQAAAAAPSSARASAASAPMRASASDLLAGVPLDQMLQRQEAKQQLRRHQDRLGPTAGHAWGGAPAPAPAPPSRPGSTAGAGGGTPASATLASREGVTSPEAAMALAAYEEAVAHRRAVPVTFSLRHPAEAGQRLRVIGGHDSLGKWALDRAPELQRGQGDTWQATVKLPEGSVTEYKYVLTDGLGNVLALQQGNNAVLAVRVTDRAVEVQDAWLGEAGGGVVAQAAAGLVVRSSREARLMGLVNDMFQQVAAMRQDLRQARLEVVGAREEAKEARAEARWYQHQLSLKQARLAEAETAHALDKARRIHAETLNGVLKTQLAETTASLKEAIGTAAELLASQGAGDEEDWDEEENQESEDESEEEWEEGSDEEWEEEEQPAAPAAQATSTTSV